MIIIPVITKSAPIILLIVIGSPHMRYPTNIIHIITIETFMYAVDNGIIFNILCQKKAYKIRKNMPRAYSSIKVIDKKL